MEDGWAMAAILFLIAMLAWGYVRQEKAMSLCMERHTQAECEELLR